MKVALEDLPVKEGFRLRGLEMTRIETFTDAAFAFALTMLVLSTAPIKDVPELKYVLRDIPTFISCAVILMIFWQGHNEWSRRFGLDDFPTMVLSVALVSTILIYVYPLRYVFGLFYGSVGEHLHIPIGHPAGAGFRVADVNVAFIIYGAGFIANSVVLVLLNTYALRQRALLQLNAEEKLHIRSEIGAWCILIAVGVISIIVALLLPEIPGSPGMTYMLLPILMPIYGSRMAKRRKALGMDSGESASKSGRVRVGRDVNL
jgi:hypothetical protein